MPCWVFFLLPGKYVCLLFKITPHTWVIWICPVLQWVCITISVFLFIFNIKFARFESLGSSLFLLSCLDLLWLGFFSLGSDDFQSYIYYKYWKYSGNKGFSFQQKHNNCLSFIFQCKFSGISISIRIYAGRQWGQRQTLNFQPEVQSLMVDRPFQYIFSRFLYFTINNIIYIYWI